MVNIIIYILIYGLFFLFLEVLKRYNHLSTDATRRIVHIGSALIAFTFPLYLSVTGVMIISSVFLILLIISKKISLLKSIHDVERKSWGEVFYPIGIAIIALIFLPNDLRLYQIAILIFGLSDVLANIVGTYWGKHFYKIFKCKKSLEGTIAFFITTFIILISFNISIPIAIFISVILSIVEFISPYGIDNLTVSVFASILLSLF